MFELSSKLKSQQRSHSEAPEMYSSHLTQCPEAAAAAAALESKQGGSGVPIFKAGDGTPGWSQGTNVSPVK